MILLKQYKNDKYSIKKSKQIKKKTLQLLHNKFGNKTISTLIADKEKQKSILKRAVKLGKNKLGDNIEEKDNSFIQKIILETITDIFKSPIEALILNNFAKKFAIEIWNKVDKIG